MIYEQYRNTNIESLSNAIRELYNKFIFGAIDEYTNSIYNLDKAQGVGLDIWGELLNFPRHIGDNDSLEFMTLTDEQYRIILTYILLRNNTRPTIENINALIRGLFSVVGTSAYVIDSKTMNYYVYVKIEDIPEWLRFIFKNYELIPRPMGVGNVVVEVDTDFIGFKGQNLHNFYNSIFHEDIDMTRPIGFLGQDLTNCFRAILNDTKKEEE